MQVAVYSAVGIPAAWLTKLLGCRTVCCAGALAGAAGLFLASYSRSLPVLLTTYSVLAGAGFGLMYISVSSTSMVLHLMIDIDVLDL